MIFGSRKSIYRETTIEKKSFLKIQNNWYLIHTDSDYAFKGTVVNGPPRITRLVPLNYIYSTINMLFL